MPSITERIIAAHQAGMAERQQAEKLAQDQEDRKFAIDVHKHQLQAMQLADKAALRAEAIQNMDLTQGKQPGAMDVPIPGVQTAPIGNSLTDPSSMGPSIASILPSTRRVGPELPAFNIPGAYGQQDIQVPQISKGQALVESNAAESYKAQLEAARAIAVKQAEAGDNTVDIPAIPALNFPGGKFPKEVAGPLITQLGTLLKPPPRIDPNSPEGIAARVDFEKKKPKTEPSVVIHTTDAQGNGVTQIVPKTVGSEFKAPPSAADLKAKDDFNVALKSLTAMQGLAKQATYASDQAMADQFFNIIKPGTGARMNQAQIDRFITPGPLKDKMIAWTQKLSNGQPLTPAARQDLIDAAHVVVESKRPGGNSGSSIDDEIINAINGK